MSSTFPEPFQSQFALRGESMTCYGSDFRNIINYEFNSQGYRADFDFDIAETESLLACFGSSIATGHGLPLEQCFGNIIAEKFNKKLWNLGQGCYRSSNQTILEQVEFLVNTDLKIDQWVIQFTHINRQGNKFDSYLELDQEKCLENFTVILSKITQLLQGKTWGWILCDYSRAPFDNEIVDHPNKITIDPDSVDFISVAGFENLAPTSMALKTLAIHPGQKWHENIAQLFIEKFQ
jgi:hypothetical protein